MRYEVVWSPAAERRLAELWLSTSDRDAVAEAADRLDDLLRDSAPTAGESRDGDLRIVFIPPLAALVEVDGSKRRVIVLGLRRF